MRTLTIPLGPWPSDSADPGGPLGLGDAPVVVVADPDVTPIIAAGARRAGREPPIAHAAAAPDLGLTLLAHRSDGAEVMIVVGGRDELRLVRALGGRPLAALPMRSAEAVAAFLDGLDVDVNVPIPTGDDDRRSAVRIVIAPLALESSHHLVEVDPQPAFDELGIDGHAASLDRLAAGAAGVLAGRLAVANARWHRDADV